jgi:hypothetical protein
LRAWAASRLQQHQQTCCTSNSQKVSRQAVKSSN